MRFYDEIYDLISIEKNQDESVSLDDVSCEMKLIYDEINQEIETEFVEECDESMREAA